MRRAFISQKSLPRGGPQKTAPRPSFLRKQQPSSLALGNRPVFPQPRSTDTIVSSASKGPLISGDVRGRLRAIRHRYSKGSRDADKRMNARPALDLTTFAPKLERA